MHILCTRNLEGGGRPQLHTQGAYAPLSVAGWGLGAAQKSCKHLLAQNVVRADFDSRNVLCNKRV